MTSHRLVRLLLASAVCAPLPLTAQPATMPAQSEAVQQALVPFQTLSQRLPPALRERLHAHARAWVALTPEEQAQLRENLTQWNTLEPQHKIALRTRFDAWEHLDATARSGALQAAAHFATLPESAQQRWKERFAALPPEQRERYLFDPSTRIAMDLARDLFPFVPVEDHSATLAMLRDLDAAEVTALRHILARLPPARRDDYRQRLLEMDGAARAVELGTSH